MSLQTGQVLIVDHDLADAQLTIDALRASYPEIIVDLLKTGDQALYYIFRAGAYSQRDSDSPLLILLDIDIPGVPCVEVLQRLKRDRHACEIPVIVLSTDDDPRTMHRCYALGANSCIRKLADAERHAAQIEALAAFWLDWNSTPWRRSRPERCSSAPSEHGPSQKVAYEASARAPLMVPAAR